MSPPKTRANVRIVQCVSEEHGKPPGEKNVETRRAGPCKEGGQPVHAKPRSLTFAVGPRNEAKGCASEPTVEVHWIQSPPRGRTSMGIRKWHNLQNHRGL